MILLTVERKWPKANYTIGRFFVDDKRMCESLEDPDRGLLSSMPTGRILQKKVYGKTAIPKGTYQVILTYSKKFCKKTWAKKYKGRVPELLGVKGFSGVRIHPLNSASETEGCVGVGDNTVVGKLTNSVARYYELMEILVQRMDDGEKCFITIK